MIVVEQVSKFYGPHAAVKNLNFEIEEGECVGFLGLNGAGKSTTLRMLSCLLLPTSGSIKIDELDVEHDPHEIRKAIGYLPDKPPVYDEMTCTQFLKFAGEIRDMDSSALKKRIPEVIDICGLDDVADQIISSLSHGYKQRVGIAQAIIHEPKLLILDEPFKGLDPVQTFQMRKMIKSLHGKHTILLSTHLLAEVEASCDRILFLENGLIEATKTKEELSTGGDFLIRVVVAKNDNDLATLIEEVEGVLSVSTIQEQEEFEIRCASDRRSLIAKKLIEKEFELLVLQRKESGLEAAFLKANSANQQGVSKA